MTAYVVMRSYDQEVTIIRKHNLLLNRKRESLEESILKEVEAIDLISLRNFTGGLQRKLKNIRNSLEKLTTQYFKHRPETSHLNCKRLFAGETGYIAEIATSRVKMVKNRQLDTSCKAIRKRVLSEAHKKLDFGIAFARIVHTDYEYLEEQLSVTYSAENHYCYHVDDKAKNGFKQQMIMLSLCLPNVYLTKEKLEINGNTGKNVNYAHLACLRLLESKRLWEYVILQQTHDIMVRTNAELKQIFMALNGSNDVQISKCPPFHYHCSSWDAKSLGIFEGSKIQVSEKSAKTPLYISKGAVQCSLSRAAVSWINRVNLTKLVQQLNSGDAAVDEMLMSSLQIADDWDMPGRYTARCLKEGFEYDGITRMVHWRDSKEQCLAGYLRHKVCVLGVEDLPSIFNYPHILVNKMMPEFDYGAIACVFELLFNRTYLEQDQDILSKSYYENLPPVLFHNHMKNSGTSLDCQNLHKRR